MSHDPNDHSDYAFPQSLASGEKSITQGGMTMRDYFAGQAITGWLASRESDLLLAKCGDDHETAHAAMGISAYMLADAMIAARDGGVS